MIGFLHPWVLAGLAAAAVPVLLHLLARREPPTVTFPAVRYLVTATREHQRRLKLQHWLLLLLRMLLIILLVLAAAGPTMPRRGVGGHAPSALVLIVDNSPSSGVVVAGTPRLRRLQAAAREVVARATPDDALWLIAADGVPRRGGREALGELLDSLTVSSRRLDLGAAVTLAGEVLAPESRPGEIVLISDLQASAVSPAAPAAPLTIARPADPAPPNVGIARLDPGAQPWSPEGGRVTVALVGDSGREASARARSGDAAAAASIGAQPGASGPGPAVPLSVRLGGRPPRQALARAGGAAVLALPGVPSGWWTLTAELAPDELRLDDERVGAVRVAPVARVACDSASRFVATACEVLASNGRIAKGNEVTVGRLGRGISIVMPPEDPAELGALNRALAARGAGWSFGMLSIDPTATDSGPVLGRVRVARRYQLQSAGSGRTDTIAPGGRAGIVAPAGSGTGILATAGGTPWLVRGGDVILIGSRLDPAWTELPTSAGFMPFMDVLLNRLARGEAALIDGAPGDRVPLPDAVTAVRRDDREWRVEGGGVFQPADRGVYYLLAGRDTVGAVSANLDPRESRLVRASDAQVRELWKGARMIDLRDAGDAAFSAAARGDLRGPLLWFALFVGLVEVGVASAWRRPR